MTRTDKVKIRIIGTPAQRTAPEYEREIETLRMARQFAWEAIERQQKEVSHDQK